MKGNRRKGSAWSERRDTVPRDGDVERVSRSIEGLTSKPVASHPEYGNVQGEDEEGENEDDSS